ARRTGRPEKPGGSPASPAEPPGGQPHIAEAQLAFTPPVPVQEELGSHARVQDLVEVSGRFLVVLSLELDVPGREPADRLWLTREIPHRRIGDGVTELARAVEVQYDGAEPRLTEYEKPRVIPIFLGHLPARANDAQELPELTRVEQRHGLPAQREEVNHQAGWLVRLRDAGFQSRESLPVVALEHQEMRVDHLMVLGQSSWAQRLERQATGLAHLPILAAPGVIEQLAAGRQQRSAALEQWIAEPGAQGDGFIDRRHAAIRIDQAERTDEKAERRDSSGRAAGLGCARCLCFVRARTLDHRAEPVVSVADALQKLDLEVGLPLRGNSRH